MTTNQLATRSLLPNIADFFNSFPSVDLLRSNGHLIKVEEEFADGKYVVRAELPGIDPDKDVNVTIRNGTLTINAKREQRETRDGYSEFSYGEFTRSLTLPQGFVEDEVKAGYRDGILTVSVPVAEEKAEGKQVKIETE
ncbi:Hsp20/alpha crystallin family protein [Gordonia aurantiaca]|uniref:Hsp20/alpha crystallin family protein n=1 Tax=Gordonia sp. B21 TaxID=3151852 RepID=UPI003267071F